MKRGLVIVGLSALLTSACQVTEPAHTPAPVASNDAYAPVIVAYVAGKKGWRREDYDIVFDENIDGMPAYYVRYKTAGETNRLGSNGKSFIVVVNPKTMTVDQVIKAQ